MNRCLWSVLSLLGLVCAVLAPRLRAESIVLINGDTLTGRVLSLDAKEVKIESELLGPVTLARARVATIQLLDQPLPPAGPPKSKPAEASKPAAAGSVDALLKQLQTGGVDAGTMKSLQDQLPLLASPEVSQYFNEKVGGLMSGKIGIADIRKDASKARDELRDLKKDLGPHGAALDAYLSILEGFLNKTEPKDSQPAQPPRPTPAPSPSK
jgi:hypothetical protein